VKYLPVWVSLILTLGCSGRCENSEPQIPPADYAFSNSSGYPAPPVAVTTAASYAYPLKVSANGRYLIDQNNKPFRIQGDSAQSLIANLTYAEAEIYLTDRQAKGFNTVNINLLEHKFAVNAPANRLGDAPFTTPGDFSTPNDAYFSFADSMIDSAASKGMLVSLAAMYLGFKGGDEGWWTTLTSPANNQAVCYRFGLYIGNRYKNRMNVLWVIGADYFPPRGSEGEARLHKFMEGIKAAGAAQLWAGDWDAPCLSTDERAFAPSMNVNAVYTYGDQRRSGATYVLAQRAYDYSPSHPAYLKETGYEDEQLVPGDRASVRKYEYWAILGGSTAGGFFGNRDIWEFATDTWWSGFAFGHGPWQKALDSPGALDMMRLGQLFDSVPWYNLIPSESVGMGKLVTECEGTYKQLDYVTAAVAADRKVLLAYVPPMANASRTIGIDMAALAGPARARWFDPAGGMFIDVPKSPFPNQGTRRFSTPGRNSGGATDWILVLQVI
jgi:hypothetical protein